MEKRGSICQAIEIRASWAPPKGPAAQSDNRCELQCKVLQQKSAAAAKRLPHAVINSLTLWPHRSPLRLKSYIHNVTLMLHYRILRDWGTLTVVQHATHKTAHTQDHQATLYLHSILFCSLNSICIQCIWKVPPHFVMLQPRLKTLHAIPHKDKVNKQFAWN